MFSKEDQRSWLKIQCARGRTARQCHQGLQEACGAAALPYRTVARWVRAFRQGRESDRNLMIRELAQDTGLAPSTSHPERSPENAENCLKMGSA
ncbi:hypothetical protein ANN_17448 [Periplaneta americana]|uniref:Mos1 transposase HTH domain-containing protein n=1 Tax=Periplaneta americana TaxID=6978 RepID=A0ABQ8SV38_PERAM|nr:hypothetical protein ANN_17448 [Periplaneta americana]